VADAAGAVAVSASTDSPGRQEGERCMGLRWPFYLSRTETKMIRTIPTRWHGTAAEAVLENFIELPDS
jgi:hypothetical protein